MISVNGKTGYVVLTKADIGLENVDNTSDLDKPISRAVQEALDNVSGGDIPASEILTKLKTVDGSGSGMDSDLLDGQDSSFYRNASNLNSGTLSKSLLPTLTKSDVGLGNVDNTSDMNKPVSTAQQNALNLKLNSSAYTASDVLTKLKTLDGSGSGVDADLLDGHDSSYFATKSDLNRPAWLSPSFVNGWKNFGQGFNNAGYYKQNGRVYLKGMISSGIVEQAAFTLPSGYRPAATELIGVISADNVGRVDIHPDGTVNPVGTSNSGWVSLDGISFAHA